MAMHDILKPFIAGSTEYERGAESLLPYIYACIRASTIYKHVTSWAKMFWTLILASSCILLVSDTNFSCLTILYLTSQRCQQWQYSWTSCCCKNCWEPS